MSDGQVTANPDQIARIKAWWASIMDVITAVGGIGEALRLVEPKRASLEDKLWLLVDLDWERFPEAVHKDGRIIDRWVERLIIRHIVQFRGDRDELTQWARDVERASSGQPPVEDAKPNGRVIRHEELLGQLHSLPEEIVVTTKAQPIQQTPIASGIFPGELTYWKSFAKAITTIGSIAEAMRLVTPPATMMSFLLLLNELDWTRLPVVVRKDGRPPKQDEIAMVRGLAIARLDELGLWLRNVLYAKAMNANSQSRYCAAVSTDRGNTARILGEFASLPEAIAACKPLAQAAPWHLGAKPSTIYTAVFDSDGRTVRRAFAIKTINPSRAENIVMSPPTPTSRFGRAKSIPQTFGEERKRATISRNVKQEVWIRDGGRCRNCGIADEEAMRRTGEHLHYDHIRPWSLNGADTVGNIQLLCGPCNRAKSAKYGE